MGQERKTAIPVGDPCQAQVGAVKHRTFIRGCEEGKYVIIDTPIVNRRYLQIPHDAALIIRYLLDGAVYGFETSLIRAYSKPHFLWALEYPDDIQIVNLRGSERVTTMIPAILMAGKTELEGAITDLSEYGGLFTIPSKIPEDYAKGSEAELFAILPTGGEIKGLRCSVQNVSKKKIQTQIGLKFEEEEDISFENNRNEPFYTLQSFYKSCVMDRF